MEAEDYLRMGKKYFTFNPPKEQGGIGYYNSQAPSPKVRLKTITELTVYTLNFGNIVLDDAYLESLKGSELGEVLEALIREVKTLSK